MRLIFDPHFRPRVHETAVRRDGAGTGVPLTWRSSDVMSREVRRLLFKSEPNLLACFHVFSVSKNKHRFNFGKNDAKLLLISASCESRDSGLDEKVFREAAAAF